MKMNIRNLTQLAMMTALILLMAFTPLGYLRVGVIEITFLMIPVVVGAILLGPAGGAILGAVFGLTSFVQCFGMSPLGVLLLGIDPVRTFIVCVLPRTLMGLFSGLVFCGVRRIRRKGIAAYALASLSGALLNTVLFIGGLGLLFYGTVAEWASELGLSILGYLLAFITLNSLVEMAACLVVGTAVTKTVHRVVRSRLG